VTLQVPFPQNERHEPDEQSSVHVPVGGHTSEQLPLEHSMVHGLAEPQLPAQPPLEQLQSPPGQDKGARASPASPFGSAIGGPPFGVALAPEPQRTSISPPPNNRPINNGVRCIGSPSRPALAARE
jgi:hypothetical protein